MRAFLITPFSAHRAGNEDPQNFANVQRVVLETAQSLGLELIHPAEMSAAGVIMQQVRDEIARADVVMAILTGTNPNVMYELGMALEIAVRPAIIIMRATEDIPFDVSHHRVLRYQDLQDISDLQASLSDAIRQTLESPARASSPQPILDLHRVKSSYEARFYYGANWVKFVGRHQEIKALRDFTNANGLFRWWIMIGAGGIGKSRLALEFCLDLAVSWRAGFVTTEPFDWSTWNPVQPTLLVADYAGGRARELKHLALSLARRQDLAFPVRLLLLERYHEERLEPAQESTEAIWYREFLGFGGDRQQLISLRYHEKPLFVNALSDSEVTKMVINFDRSGKQSANVPDQVVKTLGKLDPLRRPLFALVLADALSGDPQGRIANRTDLVRDLLARDEAHFWKPAGVTKEDKHLLALATMIGGLPVGRLVTLETHELIPSHRTFEPSHLEVMTGKPADQKIAPLEPDIIGELYALDLMMPAHTADVWRLDLLWRWAWEEAPKDMAAFLRRAMDEFPEHKTLDHLIRIAKEWRVEEKPYDVDILVYLAVTILDIWDLERNKVIRGTRTRIEFEENKEFYERLKSLKEAVGANERMYRVWGAASFNMGATLSGKGMVDEAIEIYRGLSEIAEASPSLKNEVNDGRIRLGGNLISKLVALGRLEEAVSIFNEVQQVSHSHSDQLTAAFGQFATAKALVQGFLGQGRFAEAVHVYQGINDVRLRSLMESELLPELVSTSCMYDRAQEVSALIPRLEMLCKDRATTVDSENPRHQVECELALAQFRATTGQDPKIERVCALVAAVLDLPNIRPDVLVPVMSGWFKFGFVLSMTDYLEAYPEILRLFASARIDHPELEIEVQEAALVRQFVVKLLDDHQLDKAASLLDNLRKLAENSARADVHEQWSIARSSLISQLTQNGALTEAKLIHGKRSPLLDLENGAKLRENHCKDALRLMIAYSEVKDLNSMLELFRGLDSERLAFPREQILIESKFYGLQVLKPFRNEPDVIDTLTVSIESDPEFMDWLNRREKG